MKEYSVKAKNGENGSRGRSGRVLVVDDDRRVGRLVSKVARSLEFDAFPMHDPREVVDAEARLRPDLILLDLTMPGRDGVEVLRGLANARCRATVSLVSGVQEDVVETAGQLGRELGLKMGRSLHKPLSVAGILGLLNEHRQGVARKDPVEVDLDAAIQAGHIRPHYQPKIDLATGLACGVEVLARWEDPCFGAVPPATFVAMAEESGRIQDLTACIMQRAFKEFSSLGAQAEGLGLALNLSPLLLKELDYPDLVYEWCSAESIAPERVTLELTENEAMKDPKRYLDSLVRFRLKGFQLSVDDFGTGYSSLLYVYTLPFQEIKIDREFVADLGRKSESEVVVKAMIDLGKGLKQRVVAEGVEDSTAAKVLKRLGCDMAQGYYFGRPMDITSLRAYLRGPGDSSGTSEEAA